MFAMSLAIYQRSERTLFLTHRLLAFWTPKQRGFHSLRAFPTNLHPRWTLALGSLSLPQHAAVASERPTEARRSYRSYMWVSIRESPAQPRTWTVIQNMHLTGGE